jgi:hypothetical protein
VTLVILIYVRSIESPFDRSFELFFRYSQHCLPNMSNRFIIVQSRFTTAKVDEFLVNEVDLTNQRREAFKKAVDLPPEHPFMDNDPNHSSPPSLFFRHSTKFSSPSSTSHFNAARREITKAKAKVATKVNHVNEMKSTLNLVILGIRSSAEDYNTFDHPFHKFQFTINQRTRV